MVKKGAEMNRLTTAIRTMSSQEIAELLNLRHDNVKRTIETLATTTYKDDGSVKKQAVISHPQIEAGIKSANGVVVQEYLINKRDSYVIVAQLSPEFTARLVDRWQELEAQQAPAFAIPSTLSGALMLAAKQAEQIEAQQAQLALAAPKVAFVQNYVAATTGSKGFREICKLLSVKENAFSDFLIEQGIMYRLGGVLSPAAPHLNAGRFEVKTGVNSKTGHAFNRALFTTKGVEWIAGVWARYCVKQVCGVAA